MQNSRFLLMLLFLMSIILPSISFAGSSSSTTNSNSFSIFSNNALSITSIQSSNSIATISNSSSKYINQTVIGKTFNNVMKPVSGYITYFVLIIFVIVLAYGLLEIYSEMNIEPEKKLKAMLEYILGSSSILLVAVFLYAYVGFFPQIVASSAPNLIKIHNVIPIALIWFDLFVAVIISIFGFILAIRELLNFIRTFQPTLHEDTKEFERNSSLTRFFVLLAFAFFSPLIIGLIFVITTQVFFSVSHGISTALSKIAINTSQYNVVSATVYSANLPSCGANIFSGNFWTCLGASLMYLIFSQAYTVGFEASILKTAINLMITPFGSNATFDVIYEVMVLILYVYGFIKIDWYSLEYVSSLKTGEREAYNYEKLKRAYIQYIGFIISPMLFMISLILLNAFIAMLVSAMTSNNMYLIPPLLNINGVATADNLLIDFAGLFMIVFAIILILFVIVLLLFRLIGGILFAFGLFLYLSEDYKYRAFGKNLIIGFIGIYLAPLILLLLYSFWFGFLPTAISHALGSSGLQTVQATVGGYTAKPINSTSILINPGHVTVTCNNGTSIYNALSNSNLDNGDARGTLLAGCQNFVGYWGNGYIIMAFVSVVLLLLLIFGFGTIAGAIGGLTGIGGAGSVPIFSGLSGLPMKEKISQIMANMQENRSRYAQKLKQQGGFGKVFGGAVKGSVKSTFGRAIKVGSMTENVAYGVMTAPIAGTQLGNVLDFTRQATKNVIAKTFEKPDTYAYGNADDVVNAYLEKTGGKRADETDDQAKERAKQELAKQYGFEFNDKTNTFKAKKKAIEQLKAFTGKDIKANYSNFNSVLEYDEAKQELEDAKKEQSEAQKEYEMVEQLYKDKKATKEQLDQAQDRLNKANNRVASANEFLSRKTEKLKKYGFESVEEYENKKSINDAFLQFDEAKKSGDKEKIKEAYNNLVSQLQNVAKKNNVELDGKKLKKMLEGDNSYADFQNILSTAYNLKGTENFIDFISQAVEGKKEIALKRYLMNYGGNFFKALNTELITPNLNQLKERYYSVKDILGKMKNYNIISGVDLIDVYNKEMQRISGTIGQLQSKYLEISENLTNAKTKGEIEKYKQELSKIADQMQYLKETKDKLEKTKKLVEAPALLTLSILNNKTIAELKKMEAEGKLSELPVSLSNLSRLAHGDELGRITLTKAMLENEMRIKARAKEILEKELQKAREQIKTATTESQKLQLANTIRDLEDKLKITSSEYNTITSNKNAIDEMVNELNAIRKPIITNSKYTAEKEFISAVNDFVIRNSNAYEINKQREKLVNEILDLQNKAEIINSANFKDVDEKTIRSIFDTLSKDIAKSKSPELKEIYNAYEKEDFATLRDLLEKHKRARSTLAQKFSEYANKIIEEKEKDEEELYNKQLNEIKTDFAKLLYNTDLSNSIKQQAIKFDYEYTKTYISKYLEANKQKLGLNDNEVKILQSFDSSLFNLKDEGEKRKLITIVNEKIIPVIEEMPYNKFAKIFKEQKEELQRKVEDMEYEPIISNKELKRLNDLKAQEDASRVVYNYDKLYKQITGKKPEKVGNVMKKGFKGRPVHFGQIKVENLNQNEQDINKRDGGNEQGTME